MSALLVQLDRQVPQVLLVRQVQRVLEQLEQLVLQALLVQQVRQALLARQVLSV
jgi:hypothetical protein